MEQIFVTVVVYGMLLGIFLVPFGMLANQTYYSVYRKKPNFGQMVLHFIPFYNYIMVRKYLYNNCIVTIIMTALCFLCFGFRALAMFLWAETNPWLMLISVWASIGGLLMWYTVMAYTALYCCILTRRGIITLILGTIIPFFGAYIVAKNIKKFFTMELEADSEFSVDN